MAKPQRSTKKETKQDRSSDLRRVRRRTVEYVLSAGPLLEEVLSQAGGAFALVDRNYRLISSSERYRAMMGHAEDDAYCYSGLDTPGPCTNCPGVLSLDSDDPLSLRREFMIKGIQRRFHATYTSLDNHGSQAFMVVLRDAESERIISGLSQDATMGSLCAGIVHDFNNMLYVLKAELDILRNGAESGNLTRTEFDECLGQMDGSMERISGLCSGFMQAASKKTMVGIESVRKIVDISLGLFKHLSSPEQSITITDKVDEGIYAMVSKEAVIHALLNIMANAAKHGHVSNLELTMDAESHDGRVIISIWNNGREIPDEIRESLFNEPLSSHCDQGYGLFATARRLEEFGGTVSFKSEPGGTTFYISLPEPSLLNLPRPKTA